MGPVGIVWPDVEALTVQYLTGALASRPEPVTAGVQVSAHKSSAARQVVVRDDGGEWIGDVRATARLGIGVWAGTWDDVADLAALVTALINAWPDGRPVLSARAGRGYAVRDDAGPERYLTALLTIRGTTI